MEPRIQYAKTSDGVNIAYWTLGQGNPLVLWHPAAWSNIALEWQIRPLREWYQRLASGRMLVRFDTRGQGMSERDLEKLPTHGLMLDFESVMSKLDAESCDLVGFWGPAAGAIEYAASRPDRVTRLVLWSGYVKPREMFRDREQFDAVMSLAERDWDTATETFAHTMVGWSRSLSDTSHGWAKFIKATITQRDFLRFWRAVWELDVSSLLPKVATRTLLLQHPDGRPDHSRQLASEIPGAQLVRLEPGPLAVWEHEQSLRLIEQFLELDETDTPSRHIAPSGTAVILFADIADSTGLTERLGDDAFRTKARDLDAALRTVIREHTGTPIEGKLLGDGVLAVFTGARQAIEAALACARSGDDAGLPLHLGLHAGDVIREDNNVYGGAVNIASRISGLSTPGEVLVSETVRSLARTSAGVTFEDRGEHNLKGIGEPVRVWAVRQA